HELRNPLAPIRNGLELMRLAAQSGASTEEVCAMMERQFGQLVRLVDDLLDVTRITKGKIDLHRELLPLRQVLEHAIETSLLVIEIQQHKFTAALPAASIMVEADPSRLAQVFSNLLNNAAKYTTPKGRIELTSERQGSDAVITVKDNGIGIAPDV